MTSSINTGVITTIPISHLKKWGFFCIPPTPTSKTTKLSFAPTALLRPPRARSSENTQFFEDSSPLSPKISGVSQQSYEQLEASPHIFLHARKGKLGNVP